MTIIDQISGDAIDITTIERFATTYRSEVASDNYQHAADLPSADTFRDATHMADYIDGPAHLQCWALLDDGCVRAWFPIEVTH